MANVNFTTHWSGIVSSNFDILNRLQHANWRNSEQNYLNPTQKESEIYSRMVYNIMFKYTLF